MHRVGRSDSKSKRKKARTKEAGIKALIIWSICRQEYDYRRVRAQLWQNQPSIITIRIISTSTCYQNALFSRFAMQFTLDSTLPSLCALVQEDTATLAAPLSTATISTLQSWSPTLEPRLVALPSIRFTRPLFPCLLRVPSLQSDASSSRYASRYA